MVNTIIENLGRTGMLGSPDYAKSILKYNSEFKKMGFKKVNLSGKSLQLTDIEDNLTLIFLPSFGREVYYSDRDFYRESTKEFAIYLASLQGNNVTNYQHTLKRETYDNKVELKISYKNKPYVIGDYLKDRNIVIIYLSSAYENWNLGNNNEYFPQIITYLKEVVKKYKIVEQNVEDLKEKIFISNFTKSINQKIGEFHDSVNNSEYEIKTAQENVVAWSKNIMTGRLSIKSLTEMLGQIKDSLLAKMKEIKTLTFVEGVSLDHKGIEIKFKKISIKIKDKDIEMGEYTILLMPSKIQIVNKQPVIYEGSTYHSCHIREEQICFGKNGKTTAYELLGKLELKKLCHFLYLYLKSYNPDDTYLSMNYWIKGKENGGEVPEIYDGDEEEDEYNDGETFYAEPPVSERTANTTVTTTDATSTTGNSTSYSVVDDSMRMA